jgi:hypothetical protein
MSDPIQETLYIAGIGAGRAVLQERYGVLQRNTLRLGSLPLPVSCGGIHIVVAEPHASGPRLSHRYTCLLDRIRHDMMHSSTSWGKFKVSFRHFGQTKEQALEAKMKSSGAGIRWEHLWKDREFRELVLDLGFVHS